MTKRKFLRTSSWACGLLMAGLLVRPMPTSAQSFSGEAVATQAVVNGTPVVVADTGSIAASGDALQASADTTSVAGILTAEALHAAAVAPGPQTESDSEASLAAINLTTLGASITADLALTRTTATCNAGVPSLGGSTEIDNLSINGLSVVVTGAPNQTIFLPNGQVVINEQTQTQGLSGATIGVNGMHITINGIADVVIASANSGIGCGS